MITATSAAPLYGTAAPAHDRRAMGQDEFLHLLVTQLRNQDPMSPLKPHEFAAQLAQFTSVEQLTQLNTQLGRQADAAQMGAWLDQTTLGASLLGQRIVARSDQVVIPTQGQASITLDVGTGGGTAVLSLKDTSGREVARRDLGSLSAGRQTIALPAGLPPGAYRAAVEVTGPTGTAVTATAYVAGVVGGVFFRDGAVVLRVDGIDIRLDALAEIEPAPARAP